MKRKKRIRTVSALFIMLALLCGSCLTAAAAPSGSISVTLSYANLEGHAQDGALILYQVADIAYDESGNEIYSYTSDFADCGVSLEAVSDETNHDLASALAEWAAAYGVNAGSAYTVNPADGVVFIPELSTGLYLLVQDTETTDAYTFAPFLAVIPYQGQYEVDASPKVEVSAITGTPTVTPTGTPSPTGSPTGGTTGATGGSGSGGSGVDGSRISPGSGSGGSRISPGTGSGGTTGSSTPGTSSTSASTLPQTGQLFWPIPFLAGGGLLFLLVGCILRHSGSRKTARHAA